MHVRESLILSAAINSIDFLGLYRRWSLHFKNFFLDKCGYKPRLLGFDGIAEKPVGMEELTTYRVNVAGIGREAVQCLFDDASILSKPCYKRIKGYLIERD